MTEGSEWARWTRWHALRRSVWLAVARPSARRRRGSRHDVGLHVAELFVGPVLARLPKRVLAPAVRRGPRRQADLYAPDWTRDDLPQRSRSVPALEARRRAKVCGPVLPQVTGTLPQPAAISARRSPQTTRCVLIATRETPRATKGRTVSNGRARQVCAARDHSRGQIVVRHAQETTRLAGPTSAELGSRQPTFPPDLPPRRRTTLTRTDHKLTLLLQFSNHLHASPPPRWSACDALARIFDPANARTAKVAPHSMFAAVANAPYETLVVLFSYGNSRAAIAFKFGYKSPCRTPSGPLARHNTLKVLSGLPIASATAGRTS